MQGSLQDFGVAEILQLLGTQNKTGVLMVVLRDMIYQIHFQSGRVTYALSDQQNLHETILSWLLRAEIITKGIYDEALTTSSRTLVTVSNVLTEQFGISEDLIKNISTIITSETVFRLLREKRGEYAFETDEDILFAPFIEPLETEMLLMDGVRMVDEWPSIRKIINSYSMTFSRKIPFAKNLSLEQEQALTVRQKKLRKDEIIMAVYDQIRDGLMVEDLIYRSMIGEFETCKSLKTLIEEGIIEGISPEIIRKREFDIFYSERSKLKATVFTVIILFAMGVSLLIRMYMSKNSVTLHPAIEYTADDLQLYRIRRALELYHQRNGEYPKTLLELVDKEFLPESNLELTTADGLIYKKNDRDYILRME